MRDRLHVRRALGVERVGEVADEALQPVGLEQRRRLLEEGRGDVALARLDEAPHPQPRGFDLVRGVGRVRLQRDQIFVAADLAQQDPLAVERQLELLGSSRPRIALRLCDRGAPGSRTRRPAGKVCVALQPADRAERQPFEVMVLRQVLP